MTAREFNAKAEISSNPLIDEHWAPWCGPCRVTTPPFAHIFHLLIGVIVTTMACISEFWWALPIGLLEIILGLCDQLPLQAITRQTKKDRDAP